MVIELVKFMGFHELPEYLGSLYSTVSKWIFVTVVTGAADQFSST
jgi:hypothetical protein